MTNPVQMQKCKQMNDPWEMTHPWEITNPWEMINQKESRIEEKVMSACSNIPRSSFKR